MLNRMDAASLKVEHVHMCEAQALRDMTTKARKELILETLKAQMTFRREEEGWDNQARRNRNQDRNSAVCKTTVVC